MKHYPVLDGDSRMQAHVSSRPIFWIFVRIYIYLCMSPRSTYRCIFVATGQNSVIGIDKTYTRQLMTFWSRHIFQQSVDSLSFYEIEILDQGETGWFEGSQSGHEILYHNPARLEFRWEEHNVRTPWCCFFWSESHWLHWFRVTAQEKGDAVLPTLIQRRCHKVLNHSL